MIRKTNMKDCGRSGRGPFLYEGPQLDIYTNQLIFTNHLLRICIVASLEKYALGFCIMYTVYFHVHVLTKNYAYIKVVIV